METKWPMPVKKVPTPHTTESLATKQRQRQNDEQTKQNNEINK